MGHNNADLGDNMADLIIRNATIVDGSGADRFTGDIGITGDRITAVGHVEGTATREIDANGHLVTPGWVDIHTHYDGQVTWDPEVSPSGWHGVTTIVMGNCGVGFAPADPQRRDFLIQLMEGVEDIPGTALDEGMTWNWETFPEYLDEVESMDRVLDVAALIPHGAIRAYVMGNEGSVKGQATPEQIEAMRAIVAEALEAGAVGFSTTRTLLHRAKDGELAAGTNAAAEELIGIGQALADTNKGLVSVASDMFDAAGEIAWMTEISKSSGRPVTFACLESPVDPNNWKDLIQRADDAAARGARIVPQVAGRPASLMLAFESTANPFLFHKTYDAISTLPLAERVERLSDPEVRAALLAEEVDLGPLAIVLTNWGRIYRLGDEPEYEPSPNTSIAALAEQSGKSPHEVALDIMLENDGRGLLYSPLIGYAHGNFDALKAMLDHPTSVLGLSDGGAHCGILCDASLPTYMLTHWARDRSRGERLSVEEVVHHQTQRTASLYGFEDRGVIAPGYLADLNIIDFEALHIPAPEFVYDLPAGGRRLIQRVTGYIATIKSGQVVREHDEPTGARPGRLLRGAQPSPVAA